MSKQAESQSHTYLLYHRHRPMADQWHFSGKLALASRFKLPTWTQNELHFGLTLFRTTSHRLFYVFTWNISVTFGLCWTSKRFHFIIFFFGCVLPNFCEHAQQLLCDWFCCCCFVLFWQPRLRPVQNSFYGTKNPVCCLSDRLLFI